MLKGWTLLWSVAARDMMDNPAWARNTQLYLQLLLETGVVTLADLVGEPGQLQCRRLLHLQALA